MGWDGMGWDGMFVLFCFVKNALARVVLVPSRRLPIFSSVVRFPYPCITRAPLFFFLGWDGMGWDGMGWHGMGWHGMAWHGVFCFVFFCEKRFGQGRTGPLPEITHLLFGGALPLPLYYPCPRKFSRLLELVLPKKTKQPATGLYRQVPFLVFLMSF